MAPIDASVVPFGAAMREQFLFDPNFLNLNHGKNTCCRTYQAL